MVGRAAHLYVEIEIRGSLDHVWERTQQPELHEQWDLRFTEIQYLPRPDASLPQRFLYATRIGFGLRIRGEGESVGTTDGPGGERTSALKFWSADPKSLIREGSGYWKYIPLASDGGAVRFLTRYDYDVRFGVLGRLVDRWVFRPVLGWATAWSFDRLRLWIEKGISPAISMRNWLVHGVSRLALALVFIYQGLVPKLIGRHPEEIAMVRSLGLDDPGAGAGVVGMGIAEMILGVMVLVAWRARWPMWVIVIAMPLAAIGVAIGSPGHLTAPFNPIALNLSVLALGVIALVSARDLPTAARCVRRPPRRDL